MCNINSGDSQSCSRTPAYQVQQLVPYVVPGPPVPGHSISTSPAYSLNGCHCRSKETAGADWISCTFPTASCGRQNTWSLLSTYNYCTRYGGIPETKRGHNVRRRARRPIKCSWPGRHNVAHGVWRRPRSNNMWINDSIAITEQQRKPWRFTTAINRISRDDAAMVHLPRVTGVRLELPDLTAVPLRLTSGTGAGKICSSEATGHSGSLDCLEGKFPTGLAGSGRSTILADRVHQCSCQHKVRYWDMDTLTVSAKPGTKNQGEPFEQEPQFSNYLPDRERGDEHGIR